MIQNESIYVYMKCHINQSLFVQLSLHSLTVILIFKIFVFLQNTLQNQSCSVPEYFED